MPKKKYIAKLSKIEGGDAVRTDEVVGVCEKPQLEKSFEILNDEPIEDKVDDLLLGKVEPSHRYVFTSPVVDIVEEDNVYKIETMSGSIYKIELLKEYNND